MTALPTLRRKIFRSFSILVALYAVLGLLLVVGVNLASKTTPKILHLNYDSISASIKMNDALTAIQYPSSAPTGKHTDWVASFEEALKFEEGNVTEPGEREIAGRIRKSWDEIRAQSFRSKPERFAALRDSLNDLLVVNEKGMFHLADENSNLSHQVMVGALIYFLCSLLLSIVFADQLAERLSKPLKGIVEALHLRQGFQRKLKLPEPTHLEMLILNTELKRLWEQLAENEKLNVAEILTQKNKLETLLESVEDALLVLDSKGRVLHCNECFASLVGLRRKEIQDQNWEDLSTLNPNYLKLRAILGEGLSEGQQVELDWKSGMSFFAARSREIRRNQTETVGNLYLLHDITEKKQREKFRNEFIDLLSHELKTPLQSLGTASELLSAQKANFSADVNELIDTVAEDVERIRAVAQEFVQVTQSHSKIIKLKMEIVAVNELLKEWIKPFHVVAKDRGIKIELSQEGSEVVWAQLDLVKFPWVVSNILSNAIRFSPNQTTVKVLLTDRSGGVEIRISDEGPGIPDSEKEKIFEPFYQSAVVAGAGGRGLFGIGLTIAKEVVEAHDGRIEYHRVTPHGSEFRILLPFPPLKYGEPPSGQGGESKSWTH